MNENEYVSLEAIKDILQNYKGLLEWLQENVEVKAWLVINKNRTKKGYDLVILSRDKHGGKVYVGLDNNSRYSYIDEFAGVYAFIPTFTFLQLVSVLAKQEWIVEFVKSLLLPYAGARFGNIYSHFSFDKHGNKLSDEEVTKKGVNFITKWAEIIETHFNNPITIALEVIKYLWKEGMLK